MQYMLLAHTDEANWRSASAEEKRRGAEAFAAYVSDLVAADVLVGNYRPEPSASTKTVSVHDAATQVVDGPHAGDGQLSGVYVIEVPDDAAALAWAVRNPAAKSGAVEVRPIALPPTST